MVNTDIRKLYFCKSMTSDPTCETGREGGVLAVGLGGASAVVLASCPYLFSIHAFCSHYPLKNNEEPVGFCPVQAHLQFPEGRFPYFPVHTIQHITDCNCNLERL